MSNKVDLSEFCPSDEFQFKATCYAYAVVYTALSTEYNIRNSITDKNDINSNYFSPGVVASYHNSSLPTLRRSPRCGRYGTAEKSLDILKKQGTVFVNAYKGYCHSFQRVKKDIPSGTRWYKIGGFEKRDINNRLSDHHLNWIKSAVSDNHPVIAGMYQYKRFMNIRTADIDDFAPDNETMKLLSKYAHGKSNHVICIMGYNDDYKNGNGYFLVKNNFNGWGNGKGFSWVPYTYLLPLLKEVFYINEII